MQSEPTVILVDDDQSVRESLQWLIESVDLRVVTYGSAAEFVESFDPLAPGCLVLDVRMPGMSGLELQENLAAHRCGLPVIIITGHADVPMSAHMFEASRQGARKVRGRQRRTTCLVCSWSENTPAGGVSCVRSCSS